MNVLFKGVYAIDANVGSVYLTNDLGFKLEKLSII